MTGVALEDVKSKLFYPSTPFVIKKSEGVVKGKAKHVF